MLFKKLWPPLEEILAAPLGLRNLMVANVRVADHILAIGLHCVTKRYDILKTGTAAPVLNVFRGAESKSELAFALNFELYMLLPYKNLQST